MLAKQGLVDNRVLAIAGEPREFPDKDDFEGGILLPGCGDHLLEAGPVDGAAALGLVDVLPNDDEVVALGILPDRLELRRDGEIHVLPLAGDPGVDHGIHYRQRFHPSCLLVT
ncbi:MAG: hypothetical protein HYY31_04835 [Chloroflexi bacterium]|nr:hypothetical protein [Chloroflexota bacterium]